MKRARPGMGHPKRHPSPPAWRRCPLPLPPRPPLCDSLDLLRIIASAHRYLFAAGWLLGLCRYAKSSCRLLIEHPCVVFHVSSSNYGGSLPDGVLYPRVAARRDGSPPHRKCHSGSAVFYSGPSHFRLDLTTSPLFSRGRMIFCQSR